MASMEAVCARLCLLTRFALKDGMPAPLSRPTVRRMVRLGALEGLALRSVPDIKEEHYARAEALLSRAADVYAGLEQCRAQGFRPMLPQDDLWPVNLHALGAHMPQFLFTLGNRSLLLRRAVAAAGSREIAQETMSLARNCGQKMAQEELTLVCGGARGVDAIMQRGALDRGGRLVLVPASPAKALLRQKYFASALEQGRLLLLCDTWPDEPFSAQKALSRNHTIYALGDAALVVASRDGVGGSWNGADHCLRGGYTPIFAVDRDGKDFAGNRELIRRGANAFDPALPFRSQLFGGSEGAHA